MREILANSIVGGSLYALVGLGFACVYLTSRALHFAHAAVYTWAAYSYYVAISYLAPNLLVGILFALATAVLTGLLVEIAVYRPLRMRGASELTLLLASLGALTVLQSLVSITFGDNARALPDLIGNRPVLFLQTRILASRLAIVVVATFAIISVAVLFQFSRFGRQLRALAEDPALAYIVGVRREVIVLAAMAISSATAGLAAVLQGYDVGITPSMGFDILLMSVIAAIVGGMRNILGVWCGGLLVAFLENASVWVLPNQWRDTVVLVLLVLSLLIRRAMAAARPTTRDAI